MNHLHRCTLRYPRTADEAFKTPRYATAFHGPYTSRGLSAWTYVIAAAAFLAVVFWRVG